jgi:hypothetical protein
MGWRVKVKVGKRILFSHSYPSKMKAFKASKKMRGARGIIKS